MHPYFERPISRMFNTGQSGCGLVRTLGDGFSQQTFEFFNSLSLARMPRDDAQNHKELSDGAITKEKMEDDHGNAD